MTRRCFVISPIGEAGSPEREHADDVFEFIIQPALQDLQIRPYRADHTTQAGRITDQMFRSILEDDLCIAILSYDNPNVYYELAIAQAAARPVIILLQHGQTLPFDLQDLRVIYYDLKPRPLRDGVYQRQIVEMVRHIEAGGWIGEIPFGEGLSPLGYRPTTPTLKRVENFGPADSWLELLDTATRDFWMSGLSLRWWTKIPNMRARMVAKAESGCRIQILVFDGRNPALPSLVNPEIRVGGLKHLAEEIEATTGLYRQFAAAHPQIQLRTVRSGFMGHQIVRSDDRMLVSLVLYSRTTAHYPLIETRPGEYLFEGCVGEFETLWFANTESDQGRQPSHAAVDPSSPGLAPTP